MAPRPRALCTQKPAAARGSTGKEVAAEPTTTNRNKDGVATYTYGESLNLPEVKVMSVARRAIPWVLVRPVCLFFWLI